MSSVKLGTNRTSGKIPFVRKKRRVAKTHLATLTGIAKKRKFASICVQVRKNQTNILMRHSSGKMIIVKQLSSARGMYLIKHFLLYHCHLTSVPKEPHTFDSTELQTLDGLIKVQGSMLPAFPHGYDLTILIE